MVTTTAGEVVVTGEVAARPAVASMVMANEATAMADEVRAVGTAGAALATVPVSIVAARQRWQRRGPEAFSSHLCFIQVDTKVLL